MAKTRAQSRSKTTSPKRRVRSGAVAGKRQASKPMSSSATAPTKGKKKISENALQLKKKMPDVDIDAGGGDADLPCLSLNKCYIDNACVHLCAVDDRFTAVIESHGPAYGMLEKNFSEGVFEALARAIVYQQLAGKAAATIHRRLLEKVKPNGAPISPAWVLRQSIETLRSVGLSERKASYLKDLASHCTKGLIPDKGLEKLSDDELFERLTAVKGIGPWTTQMFMMFTLKRPNVLPTGDLGVQKGVQKLYCLKKLPNAKEMEAIASKWSPYRSVGSYYMWRVADTKL